MAPGFVRSHRNTWMALLLWSAPLTSLGAVEPIAHDRFARDQMTCRSPVPLTRDCSDRNGPTRPIALGTFRMNLAGTSDGRTLFITQVRHGPDHNGREFAPEADRHETAIAAIRALRTWLHRSGACLELWQPLRHAGRVRGYLMTFSDDVYSELQRLTLLESEHWLPRQITRR